MFQNPLPHGHAVLHGMEEMDALQLQTRYGWTNGLRTGGDDQAVIGELHQLATRWASSDRLRLQVDAAGFVLEQEFQAGRVQLIQTVVGQLAPIRGLSTDVEGKPADAVVGEGIG